MSFTYVAHEVNNIAIISKVNDIYHRDEVETLWLDIKFDELDLLLACIYRPPSNCITNSDEILLDTIGRAESERTVILAGDFNLCCIQWSLQNLQRNDKLYDANSNLRQLVTHITRKRYQETSLLDFILCNEDNLICDIEYHPPIDKSDHLVISATIQVLHTTNTQTTTEAHYSYYKADLVGLCQDVIDNLTINESSVNDMWFSLRIKYTLQLRSMCLLSRKTKTVLLTNRG